MARFTAETLLISSVVNSLDPHHHTQWGIERQHFVGYRDEFEWLEAFCKEYERTPTRTELETKWPDFPFSADQEDGKWPAAEVVRQFNTRTVLRTALRASEMAKGGDVDDALELIRGMNTHKVVEPPKDLLRDPTFLDDYHTPEDRIAVPWSSLQERTSGIGVGELWYIAARPSNGKSAHCAVIAAEAALQGRRVIIYSLEMTKRAYQIRMQAILAHRLGIRISSRDMKSRRYDALAYKRLMDEISERVPGQIHIHTPAEGPTKPSVVAARADSYELNIVDYIGLMRADGKGRAVDDWRVMAGISNEMKEIALAARTRMVVASQINREGESAVRPPLLKNLSQSDALGQDGDVVLTLMKYGQGASMFSLEKNRDGESNVMFFTSFDPETGNYDEISRDDADEIRQSVEN